LQSEERSRILALMEALHREAQQGGFGSPALQESLLVQLLVQVNRLALRQDTQPRDMPHINTAVSKVIDYVNLHYGEQLSLDMLAERFFVSKYHLSHEFNRQVGTSIYRYIQKKRLLIARQLMAQGKRPNEVYSVCGFGDYAGFYRAFKAEYGTGPREYALSVRQTN
jgi:AraC-like DNA-binding protein